jgi:hypothetical protein
MTLIARHTHDHDDGLVHAHGWSQTTPPGMNHTECRLRRSSSTLRDREEAPVGD